MQSSTEVPQAEGRAWSSVATMAIMVLGIAMVAYHLVSAHYFLVGPNQHQNIHLGFALLLLFLVSLKGSKKPRLVLVFLVLSLICIGYVGISCEKLVLEGAQVFPAADILIIGALLVILLLEGTRRAFGWILPGVIILFILYPFFGHYIPGALHIPYIKPAQAISRMGIGCLGLGGVYGTFLGISANMIFLFVVFGGLLHASGATRFFVQIGRFVGGKLAGGPALAAVVTSGLVGSVTGSVGANIVLTGSFTIPLMKEAGYRPEQAGAIEATASTGGLIMPPVMGAVAFMIAAFCGIPYVKVMLICLLPAVLYYLSAAIYVQLQALKMNTPRMTQKASVREMLVSGPLFVVPLAIILILLIGGHGLAYTMSFVIPLLIVLSFIRKETRSSLKQWANAFAEAAALGSQIAVSCAAMGAMMAAISLTGLSIKIPSLVEVLCGGNLTVGLILAMIASIILGMGMTSIGAYCIVAIVAGPALMRLGLTMIEAHLFAFYFAVLSYVTPPVAVGALVASKVAGSPFIKTAIEATKVAIGGLIVPYLFIWCPVLLLKVDDPLWATVGLIACFMLIALLQIVVCGYYLTTVNLPERVVFTVIALMIFLSLPSRNYEVLAAAVFLFILASLWQGRKRKKVKRDLSYPN